MKLLIIIFGIAASLFIYRLVERSNDKRREKYIDRYYFHKGIKAKLAQRYPNLSDQQLELILKGLREYFQVCRQARKKLVSMPSQAVDEAWHQFILSTRLYSEFCNKAFGYYLHHTPAEAMPTSTIAKEGIKRSWRLACAREKIDPRRPTQLPLLFAIDGLLAIPNGFFYQLNCREHAERRGNTIYCAGDIACSTGCIGDFGGEQTEGADCASDGGGGCSGD
ncbi:MAG: hypothetical protein Kow0065_05630 [Methylomicrobium sp.]